MRALGILLLGFGAACAKAGDPPAAPVDPIAAAKRDFASIKSPSSAVEPGAGTSGVAGKADGAAADAAAADAAPVASSPGLSMAGPPGRREGTGNWLVDAMEQKPDRPRALGGMDDLAPGDLDLLKAADRPDRHEAGASQSGEKAPPGAMAGPVYNPLDAFMRGWVSPRDRELLLPARADNPLGGAPGAARSQLFSGLDLGQPGAPAGAAQGDPRTSGNPYVADLYLGPVSPAKAPSLPDVPAFAPLELPDLSRGMSALGAGISPLGTARPAIPDFAQPADDDKYFKQLKRF